MKTILLLLIIILILALTVFILRFVIGSPEDDWICDADQWIKHGNPSQPMPNVSCLKQK